MPPLNPSHCVQVACIDDDNWQVVAPYTFVSKLGCTVLVEAGFITDGASVPRILWSAIPLFGRHFNAAVIHDRLYREPDAAKKLPKDTCDRIFLEIMERDGVSEERRIAMYEAVRACGASSYCRGKEAAAKSLALEEEEPA